MTKYRVQGTGKTEDFYNRKKQWLDAEDPNGPGLIDFLSIDEATGWAVKNMVGEYQIITVHVHGEIVIEKIENKINKVLAY